MGDRLKFDIRKLPFYGNLIDKINDDLKHGSPPQAMRNFLATIHTRLVKNSTSGRTWDVLEKSGVILVFNHPFEFETIATIASLPDRHDIYMIITRNLLGICPNLDRYLLPVDIEHHARREKAHKLSGIIANWLQLRPKANEKEARIYNRNTISRAIGLVKKGGIVAICPEGMRSTQGAWFPGIGHLISGVGATLETYVVFVYIQGTSNLDYFRLVPIIGVLCPKISVTFGSPIEVNEILSQASNPQGIKLFLENTYKTWAKTLT